MNLKEYREIKKRKRYFYPLVCKKRKRLEPKLVRINYIPIKDLISISKLLTEKINIKG